MKIRCGKRRDERETNGKSDMNEVLRQEKKYAINLKDGTVLQGRLGAVMHGDVHNGSQGYVIRSLYFDTPDDQDFHDKIDGLELRRKIRLRTYSPQSEFAMLEMKQKEGQYQRKRSLRLDRAAAEALCRGDYSPLLQYADPFATECYGLMHCRCYRPKAVVEYHRQAFVARKITSGSPWTAASLPRSRLTGSFPKGCPCIRSWIPSTWCWR